MRDEKADIDKIKTALYAAFAMDEVVAYKEFIVNQIQRNKSVIVYLAELRKLAVLCGAVSNYTLRYAFVAGLAA